MYKCKDRVSYSRIDTEGKLKVYAIVNAMQDCSLFHSEDVGLSCMDLKSEDAHAWLVNSWDIVIKRRPIMGEVFEVSTWPYKMRGVFGMRNFVMKTEEGETLAYADSHWFFFDQKTGTPVKPEPEEIWGALKGAHALNVRGLNVTVPHKQAVMPFLKEIDEGARVIGAVNTLVWREDGYVGYNTDAAGILRAMKEEGIVIKDSACILIGAGGAAKAAGYVLVKNGARVIYILNRSLERAKELAQELNLLAGRELAKPVALADYRSVPKDSYLAVQTTSVGMSPKADAAPVEDREFYSMIHTGFDAVYTPAETKFMRYIKDAGGKACNGLMMLLYQGVIGYELWNPGVTVRPETVEEAKGKVLELLGR